MTSDARVAPAKATCAPEPARIATAGTEKAQAALQNSRTHRVLLSLIESTRDVGLMAADMSQGALAEAAAAGLAATAARLDKAETSLDDRLALKARTMADEIINTLSKRARS